MVAAGCYDFSNLPHLRMFTAMPAHLLSLTDGPSVLLDKPILLFGRHPECDVQLESKKVSRRHCCLAQVGEAFVIRDLGSTNGVKINGVRYVPVQMQTGPWTSKYAAGDSLALSTRIFGQWNRLGANEELVTNPECH